MMCPLARQIRRAFTLDLSLSGGFEMKSSTVILRCAVAVLAIPALAGISASASVADDDPGAVYVLQTKPRIR